MKQIITTFIFSALWVITIAQNSVIDYRQDTLVGQNDITILANGAIETGGSLLHNTTTTSAGFQRDWIISDNNFRIQADRRAATTNRGVNIVSTSTNNAAARMAFGITSALNHTGAIPVWGGGMDVSTTIGAAATGSNYFGIVSQITGGAGATKTISGQFSNGATSANRCGVEIPIGGQTAASRITSLCIAGTPGTLQATNYGIFETLNASNNPATAVVKNAFSAPVGIGVTTTNPTFFLQLDQNSAAKPTSASWTVISDERSKKNIKTANLDLSKLDRLRVVNYQYDGVKVKDEGVHLGLIAQEVQSVFPEWVETRPYTFVSGYKKERDDNGDMVDVPINETIEDFKTIDTGELVYYLLLENRTLKARITTLETQVSVIDKKLKLP